MNKKMIPLTLEQHQQVLYEILYMVDDFCKAHEIPYFLVGGTLLGAVRHKGIIPWDDDIDIAMTRENYEIFIKMFHQEGVDGYELFDCEHTDGYLLPFAKMTKKNSWTSSLTTHRIFIDVFAYDGCGDNIEEAQVYFTKIRSKTARLEYVFIHKKTFKKKFSSLKERVSYFFKIFPKDLFTFYPILLFGRYRQYFFKKMFLSYIRFSVTETKYSANIMWGMYGVGEIQPSVSFLVLDKMQFGSRELPVPSGWHGYLTGLYKDYMKLPPKNKRANHLTDGSYLIIEN